jgi:hypothetical protein
LYQCHLRLSAVPLQAETGNPRSSSGFKKLRNSGGFQPRFPLYRTETRLSGFQGRTPHRFKTLKTQQLKGKRL